MMAGNGIESQWTTNGFMVRFDELLKDARWEGNYLRTYIATEEEHIALFGSCRYKNYESFRQTRRNWIFKLP